MIWIIWKDLANGKGVVAKGDIQGNVAKVFQVASDLIRRGHLCDTMFLRGQDMQRAWTIFLEQVRGAFHLKRWPRILSRKHFRDFISAILSAVWRFSQHELTKKLNGMETRDKCSLGPIVNFARKFLDDVNEARSPWDLVDMGDEEEDEENGSNNGDDDAWGGTLTMEYHTFDEGQDDGEENKDEEEYKDGEDDEDEDDEDEDDEQDKENRDNEGGMNADVDMDVSGPWTPKRKRTATRIRTSTWTRTWRRVAVYC